MRPVGVKSQKMNKKKAKTVKTALLIASSGGHWVQLNRLAPAFDGMEKIYATTEERYRETVQNSAFLTIPDASRWNKFKVMWLALIVLTHIVRIRPDVVISTGAAPGTFAVIFGKLLGAKTIWVDSIANVDQLSLSGRLAGRFADLWLTQWEHLAQPDGPHFKGAVL